MSSKRGETDVKASRRIAFLLAAGLALSVGPVAAQGVEEDSILIGMEGLASSFSVDEENLGMRLLIAQVNEDGGIHGRKLVERSYPRASVSPREQAVLNAKRLVEDDEVFLLFNFGGPSSVEIGAYAMKRQVPYLFPHTALLTLDGARYVFTSYPRYDGESRVMLRYLAKTLGVKSLGVIHDPNVYGQYFVDRARELAPELVYRFVGHEPILEARPEDAMQAVRRLRDLGPEAVILALYPAQARRVMEAKASLGWSNVRFVSSGPLTDEQYLNVGGDQAEGTLGFCHFRDPERASGRGFDEYRALMAKHYPDHELNRYSLYGYVFGKLVAEGLRRAGRELTREKFIDAMESIRDWDSGSVLPPVSFSKTNHHAQRAGFVCELRDGSFRELTDWVEP
jgi:branched-chain amino acid transport system substrate-binding protein